MNVPAFAILHGCKNTAVMLGLFEPKRTPNQYRFLRDRRLGLANYSFQPRGRWDAISLERDLAPGLTERVLSEL